MDPQQLLAGVLTTSDKIRILDAAGYPRAEIARTLGKLYQHVRNVLNAATPEQAQRARHHVERLKAADVSPTRQPPGVEEGPAPWRGPPTRVSAAGVTHLTVGPDGEVVLPPEVLAALDLAPGYRVTARLDGETFTLISMRENHRRIREIVRQYIPDDVSLADDLIADRHREAAREEGNG